METIKFINMSHNFGAKRIFLDVLWPLLFLPIFKITSYGILSTND
jgi:hypothetical protein